MKNNYTLGDLLRSIREDKGIKQGALCKGLCDQSTISRIENGSPVQNRLLLNALIQRLGETPNHFITIVTPEELKYYEWQSKVYDALNQGDKDIIRMLLCQESAVDRSCHVELQEQFYQYMRGYVERDIFQMKTALKITMPDIENGISSIPCMGTTEIFLLLVYIEQRLLYEKDGVDELRECIEYLEQKLSTEERIKLYPQAVVLLCKYGNISNIEKVEYCKTAINLLREELSSTYMPVLLEELVLAMKKLKMNDVEKYENYRWAFQELYALCGINYWNDAVSILNVGQEMYKLGDVICLSRKERRFSREKASENICDVLTLGRLERGERGTKVNKYHKFRDKLELSYEDIYCARLMTNDYRCIQVGEEIQRKIRKRQFDGLKEKIEWLRQHLDLSIKKNRQYVEMEEQAIGSISPERTKEILRITIPDWHEEYQTHLYTSTEIQLVNQVAKAYCEQRDFEKADKIIRTMWKNVDMYDYSLTMLAKELITVLTTWIRCLNYLNLDKEALEKYELGMHAILMAGHSDKLSLFITEKCRILDKKTAFRVQSKEEIIKSYKEAYYFSVLYGQKDLALLIRDFLEKNDIVV